MPPLRTQLRSITPNRPYNHQLTLFQRGIAIGLSIKGAKSTEIEDFLEISRRAVRSTLTLAHLRDDGEAQVRSGRPVKFTPADERNLLRHVRLHPKDTYTEVIVACGLKIKRDTVKRILKKYGIVNWRARRRPFLTEKNAAKRLA